MISVKSIESKDWNDTRFRENLVNCPRFAWVSVIFFFIALLTLPIVSLLSIENIIPTWLALTCNTFCLYMLFMVMHDSAHRSVSQIAWFNDWLGRASVFLVIPFAVLPSWRFAHLRHHANTNEDNGDDPDIWVSKGPRWLLPLRWATLDLSYLIFFFPKFKELKRNEINEWILSASVTFLLFFIAGIAGHLYELMLFWILPSRINVFLVAFIFDYLPHNHHIAQKDKPFSASKIRVGWDIPGCILTMNQNYHTMHHVYPRIPFYKIRQAWFAKLGQHLQQQPAIVTWFGRELEVDEYCQRHLPKVRFK